MTWYKKLSNTSKFLIKLTITIVVIVLIILACYFLFKQLGWLNLTRDEVQQFISSFGMWGPIIFILVSFLQVTFIPIPSTVTIIAGAYLFGFWQGFIYSYIGIILGSIFAYMLGKRIGRPLVNWLAGGKEKVDKLMTKMKGKERVVVFFMFLFPFFPDDLIAALCGIVPSINWPFFLITQFITRATSILGNLIFLSGTVIPYNEPWGIALIVIFCLIALMLFVLSFIYSDKLNKLFDRFTTWIQIKVFKKEKNKEKKEVEVVKETPRPQVEKTTEENTKPYYYQNFKEVLRIYSNIESNVEEEIRFLEGGKTKIEDKEVQKEKEDKPNFIEVLRAYSNIENNDEEEIRFLEGGKIKTEEEKEEDQNKVKFEEVLRYYNDLENELEKEMNAIEIDITTTKEDNDDKDKSNFVEMLRFL